MGIRTPETLAASSTLGHRELTHVSFSWWRNSTSNSHSYLNHFSFRLRHRVGAGSFIQNVRPTTAHKNSFADCFTRGIPRKKEGIQPLVASSPLMFWLYKVFSLQGVSNLIGVIEIAVAVLIALRPFSARLSFAGSIGAIITFVLTVSFLLSTPGAIQFSHGFLLLGDAGQFLIKDLVLLGASIWTAAEARKEA